jgi:putative two-component system response regulator
MSYKILFVDDEAANLRLLERLFAGMYEVLTAESGQEALDKLAVHDVALIISDQRMPAMSGIEFLKRSAELRPQTVRMILTGYTDAGDLVDAINSGVVYKFVTKPWVNDDLRQTVRRALQHYETTKAQRTLQRQNERLQRRLKTTCETLISMTGRLLDAREPRSSEHAFRTAKYAESIGERMGLDRARLDAAVQAASLHELAFYDVPVETMLGQGDRTAADREALALGLGEGLKMLEGAADLEEAVFVLGFVAENFDGSGQPSGFSGDQIPLEARIIAVACAYDSARCPRTDRDPVLHTEAVKMLRKQRGTKFDPAVLDTLEIMTGSHEPESVLELAEV